MQTRNRNRLGITIACVVLLSAVLTATACAADEAGSSMAGTLWALIPPFVAIALALITKEVYSSLFIGVLIGALLASNFSFTGTIDVLISDGLIAAVAGTAGVFAFLVILGILVALMNKAGGSAAFGTWAQRNIKTRVGASLATFVLGVLIFVDDYFNCLTVGSVMRPVTDSHRISRAKLAYLIDATAAPVCMIAPISSWAAAVASYTEGTGYSGLQLFIKAIPYNYYSLLTMVFIVTITLMKFDYGPMRLHEANARLRGDLYTIGDHNEVPEVAPSSKGTVSDLVIPMLLLIACCVVGLIYVGGFFAGESFVDAFANTDATVGLPWGALIALVLTVVYLLARRVISFHDAMECVPQGFIAMVPALLILTLATALKNMTGLLGAADYVAGVMKGAAAGLSVFLPAMIFLVACILSFASGTSWGTFGILIPIVCAIFSGGEELLIVGISACLAGAVCGDHCSPISDTTIMSSAGGQCNHINHVSTQLPYAISVAAISFIMFLLAGLIQNPWIVLPIGIVATVGFLLMMKKREKKKYSGEV